MNCNVVAVEADRVGAAVVNCCRDDEGVGFNWVVSTVGINVCVGFDVIIVGAIDAAIAVDGEYNGESSDNVIVGTDDEIIVAAEGVSVTVGTNDDGVSVPLGIDDGVSVAAIDGEDERSPAVTGILLGSIDGVPVVAIDGEDERPPVVTGILLGSTEGVSVAANDGEED